MCKLITAWICQSLGLVLTPEARGFLLYLHLLRVVFGFQFVCVVVIFRLSLRLGRRKSATFTAWSTCSNRCSGPRPTSTSATLPTGSSARGPSAPSSLRALTTRTTPTMKTITSTRTRGSLPTVATVQVAATVGPTGLRTMRSVLSIFYLLFSLLYYCVNCRYLVSEPS